MLSRGFISEPQLQAALEAQHHAGEGRIGEWMQRLHFTTERQVLACLSIQWACPLLALHERPDFACARRIPLPLLRSLHCVPVRFVHSGSLLYIAVSKRVDYAALAAIENMLDCRAIPGLIGDRQMERMLESVPHPGTKNLHTFDRISGIAEMARITASYAATLGADEIRMGRCVDFEWVRIRTARRSTDLLFALSDLAGEKTMDLCDWSSHQAS